MMLRSPSHLLALAALLAPCALPAAIRMPAIFSDHSVLQQDAEVTLWGWAGPTEELTITTSWGSEPIKTKCGPMAIWQVKLKTPDASAEPQTITIKGWDEHVIHDVLIGDVWLCSGQSNMEWTVGATPPITDQDKIIAGADQPQIHLFVVDKEASRSEQDDVNGHWEVCTPDSVKTFSAIGYIFGRDLHDALKRPVGLIDSTWGGTPAESWTPTARVAESPSLAAAAAVMPEHPWGPQVPGVIFNAMIAPLTTFPIKGAIWYQGESNVGHGDTYAQLMQTMVAGWRARWGYEFPFYYVQIANWKGYGGSGAALRDSQRRALDLIPNSGMTVITDYGNDDNIHPHDKLPVGHRLAAIALGHTYGLPGQEGMGPLFKGAVAQGSKVVVSFTHADGLQTRDAQAPGSFQLAGADGNWADAEARIEGNQVIVSAQGIDEPRRVRFAWSDTANPTLENAAGVPASSFEAPVK